MTHHPDEPHRDKLPDGAEQPEPDQPAGGASGDGAFDEEAAWRMIVENYGERPEMGAPVEPDPPRHPLPANPFDRTFADSLDTEATWQDEGHFVPPEPPPLPRPEPRRRLAWAGLFGTPVVLLLAAVLHLALPTWAVTLLVVGFVGGFVYLVATMPRTRHDDWPGDDGAVV
jgi:hypothetical protein